MILEIHRPGLNSSSISCEPYGLAQVIFTSLIHSLPHLILSPSYNSPHALLWIQEASPPACWTHMQKICTFLLRSQTNLTPKPNATFAPTAPVCQRAFILWLLSYPSLNLATASPMAAPLLHPAALNTILRHPSLRAWPSHHSTHLPLPESTCQNRDTTCGFSAWKVVFIFLQITKIKFVHSKPVNDRTIN